MEIHPYKDISGFENQLNLPLSKIYNEGYLNGGIWFNDTATLLCGTFPPKQEYHNRKGYIHYSSPRNKLWRHIDNLYSTSLYIPSRISTVESSRIENAIRKISFLRNKKIGLVDVFTKVSRKQENSCSDSDLIPLETIFDTNTFDTILSHRYVK